MHGNKPGHLRVTRTRVSTGKVIDEWHFDSPLNVRGREAPQLSVQVSLKSEGKGITFIAHGKCLPKELVDTDIERLRKAVEAELRFQHDSMTGLEWHDWLEVQVRSPLGCRRIAEGNGLEVFATPIKRAIDPTTGQALTLNANNLVSPFPLPKSPGEADADSMLHGMLVGRDVDSAYSYVPASPENVAALKNILQRIDELRGALSTFLSQEQVHDSLRKVVDEGRLLLNELP